MKKTWKSRLPRDWRTLKEIDVGRRSVTVFKSSSTAQSGKPYLNVGGRRKNVKVTLPVVKLL